MKDYAVIHWLGFKVSPDSVIFTSANKQGYRFENHYKKKDNIVGQEKGSPLVQY